MSRKIATFGLASVFALAASAAFACPFMKQDQVTQAPMSPIASVEEPMSSALATNDLETLPQVEAATDDKTDE
ncbi:hypothetical protein [Breoghania sp. L-A4]|uniref:hypothetical protein n=1 Tax=Breoghania sp. L-A4 TaxID=2304600 RepID=UPI000E35CF5E|nr:hypothetical protein [Breoghania sp. L-A4]AXS39043.1 hypothetical protein D1F64_01905 [Breoghania sp. L-A4]